MAIAEVVLKKMMHNNDNNNHLHGNKRRRHNDDDDDGSRRIVLLFDLDCFYAQCERVRLNLGLPDEVALALLQWNSVLAVTYPARRQFGIKRGDGWDDIQKKTTTTTTTTTSQAAGAGLQSHSCHTIHLQVLQPGSDPSPSSTRDDNAGAQEVRVDNDNGNEDDEDDDGIQKSYEKVYKLSPEQLLEARKELGVRRFHHQGKACLERYRIASMRIFTVVLESLSNHLGKDKFILERASIDEFYLDITNFCYDKAICKNNKSQEKDCRNYKHYDHNNTVLVGEDSSSSSPSSFYVHHQRQDDVHGDEQHSIQNALHRACQVSHWIRADVWNLLGFTMSAGISTNKMMAKLAASYGKPNGQAMLHPSNFGKVMSCTKITKVRHFGGKLGREVIQKVLNVSRDGNNDDDPTMSDLIPIPLPQLQQRLKSREKAQFVYNSCRGIDNEPVKETSGALVKSITAFKSFTATSNHRIIQKWLDVIVTEIVGRVTKDSTRNKRYPKSCTLNYTYYTTTNGQRPKDGSHRTQRNTRSIRLEYPHERNSQKVQLLKQHAMNKLLPVLSHHPLRGVGLSANNFESRGGGQHLAGVASIDTFFSAPSAIKTNGPSSTRTLTLRKETTRTGMHFAAIETPSVNIEVTSVPGPASSDNALGMVPKNVPECKRPSCHGSNSNYDDDLVLAKRLQEKFDRQQQRSNSTPFFLKSQEITIEQSQPLQIEENTLSPSTTVDEDMEYAKKLQAKYDRENSILTSANNNTSRQRATPGGSNGPAQSKTKKVRRIDTFFQKR